MLTLFGVLVATAPFAVVFGLHAWTSRRERLRRDVQARQVALTDSHGHERIRARDPRAGPSRRDAGGGERSNLVRAARQAPRPLRFALGHALIRMGHRLQGVRGYALVTIDASGAVETRRT
jgi:hypothetical protein